MTAGPRRTPQLPGEKQLGRGVPSSHARLLGSDGDDDDGPRAGPGREGTQPSWAEQRRRDRASREPRTRAAGVGAPGRVTREDRRTGRVCLEMEGCITVPAARGTTTAEAEREWRVGGKGTDRPGCLKDHPRGGCHRRGRRREVGGRAAWRSAFDSKVWVSREDGGRWPRGHGEQGHGLCLGQRLLGCEGLGAPAGAGSPLSKNGPDAQKRA